jgi:hypothetical protein
MLLCFGLFFKTLSKDSIVMLVYYSGWGYWEENNEELNQSGRISCFKKVHSLFELPKGAEMDITYLGEAITDHLLITNRSNIEEPNPTHGGDVYFVLCDEPFAPPAPASSLEANKITKKFTKDDIQPDIIDGAETPKNLTESARKSLLKLILGMAIDAYGYVPGATKDMVKNNFPEFE